MNVGDRIGEFELLECLGQGDFGSVFRVNHEGQMAALKIAGIGNESAKRLINEGEALKELDNSDIPKFISSGTSGGYNYLLMSLATGRTLQSQLREREKEGVGAHFGDITILQLVSNLLKVVMYIHSKEITHRDIKDANIMVNDSFSKITLIDFGFAKKSGSHEIRLGDSFFRAGAARFSPLAKLEDPAVAVPNHDVYAIGIIAYRMLTGQFPYEDLGASGIGGLKKIIKQSRPANPRMLNPEIRGDVSDFVELLILQDDDKRPSAEIAYKLANDLLENLSPAIGSDKIIHYTRLRMPFVTRDPIHGDVRLTVQEKRILDTPQVQRLRRFGQLGLSNLVYIGARHSRLEHSIGTVFRVEQILRGIEEVNEISIDEITRSAARIYALIHDVANIPFGHTLEDELGFFQNHENNTNRINRIVLDTDSELNKILNESGAGRQVLALFDLSSTIHARTGIKELVSGITGADVLDYINRDSHYCGLDHRIDNALFRQFHLDKRPGDDDRVVSLLYGNHGVRIDREFAVESLLLERFAMFLKVYTHPTKNAASALLGKALAHVMFKSMGKCEIDEKKLEQMGDDQLIVSLSLSHKKIVSQLAKALLMRKLPRPVFRAQLLHPDERTDDQYKVRLTKMHEFGLIDPKKRLDCEAVIAKAIGVEPDTVFIYCSSKVPGYQRMTQHVSRSPGETKTIDEVHSAFTEIRKKHLGLWELWVYTTCEDETTKRRLAAEVSDRYCFTNLLTPGRISGRLL